MGLGEIGSGVARALAAAGYTLVARDPDARVRQRHTDITLAGSPAAVAAQSEVVLVAVYDDAQVRDVLTGHTGILAGKVPTSDIVVLSTVSLDTIRWAAAACDERGITLLDCGVTGGPQALAQASIVAMVGGPDHAVARVRPVLDAFSAPVVHTGPVGTGMQAKLARNLLYFAGCHVAWEAARLAQAAGVAPETLIEIVEASELWTGGSTAILKRGFLPGDPSDTPDPATRARMAGFAHKDLEAALRLGAELGVELPAAALATEHFDAVVGLQG